MGVEGWGSKGWWKGPTLLRFRSPRSLSFSLTLHLSVCTLLPPPPPSVACSEHHVACAWVAFASTCTRHERSFAIAGWSLPGAAFALYTLSNLVPRARKVREGRGGGGEGEGAYVCYFHYIAASIVFASYSTLLFCPRPTIGSCLLRAVRRRTAKRAG